MERVLVQVPVKCVSGPDLPAMPRPVYRPDGDLKQDAAAAAADVLALQDYANRAEALLRQCAQP